MADARLGQTNPLSLIGRSATPPQSNEALAALVKGATVQSLANKGGLDRQALANIGARNTAGVSLGLNFDDPNIGSKMEELRGSTMALRGMQALNQGAGAGVRTTFPSSFNPTQAHTQPVSGGHPLKGEAQSLALPRVEASAKQGTKTSITDVVDPMGLPVGITSKRVREGTSEVSGKQKQTPLAEEISTDLLNAAKAQFPGVNITEDSFTILKDGTIILSIPGQPPIVVGKRQK